MDYRTRWHWTTIKKRVFKSFVTILERRFWGFVTTATLRNLWRDNVESEPQRLRDDGTKRGGFSCYEIAWLSTEDQDELWTSWCSVALPVVFMCSAGFVRRPSHCQHRPVCLSFSSKRRSCAIARRSWQRKREYFKMNKATRLIRTRRKIWEYWPFLVFFLFLSLMTNMTHTKKNKTTGLCTSDPQLPGDCRRYNKAPTIH